MVSLTLEGVETCSNQRQFCLESPPVLAKPQLMTTIPPSHHPAQSVAAVVKKSALRTFVSIKYQYSVLQLHVIPAHFHLQRSLSKSCSKPKLIQTV